MEAMGQLAAVAGVLGLLVAALWWLRRHGFAVSTPRGRSARRLEALERLPLGPQQSLHLVRVGDTALLVASSPAGCVLLERLAWREIEAPRGIQP
jgi:flagellar biosynthetic protein FliO